MKDAVATMGMLLPEDAGGRDAVHVAVFSATSDENLSSSQPVAIIEQADNGDAKVEAAAGESVGLTDPFIRGIIPAGTRFWVYLYPRTITGLSHRWTHPAFEDTSTTYATPNSKAASEAWLRGYAREIDEDFSDLVNAADAFLDGGEYFYGRGDGDGYYGKFEGVSTHPDFWPHYQIYRGKIVPPDQQQSFFTCSC